ncbi:MAG: hypothetical protein FK733_12825 [Asgard group archaeon]|nr:hypothetical protein [Asgard group archaeon]
MSKRIISLDIIRGWAILGNLLVHFFMITSEVQGYAEDGLIDLEHLGYSGFVLMGLVVVFGHWRGLFLLISAAVHWYVMKRKLDAGISRNVILRQEIFKGILLFMWAMIFYVFIGEWVLTNQWADLGSTATVDWRKIYHVDQFTNIAVAIFITAIVFYFWSRNEKSRKPWIAVTVFAVLGLAFVFPAPYVLEAANNFWGVDFSGSGGLQKLGEKGWWDYPVRFIVNQFISRESPLMPHYAYSAAGAIVGIFLSRNDKISKKKFLGWGFGIAGFCLLFGGFWFLVVDKALTLSTGEIINLTANFHIHPTWYVFATLGLLLIFVMSVFAIIQFCLKYIKRFTLIITRFSRRAGFLSLSVYSLAFIQQFLRVAMWAIIKPFNLEKAEWFRTNLGMPTRWVVFMMVLEIAVWLFILWIWEKGRYIGSPDWLFAAVLKAPSKMKEDKKWLFKDPLDVQSKLMNVDPFIWPEPKIMPEELLFEDEEKPLPLEEDQPVPTN